MARTIVRPRTKFQADLTPADVRALRALKDELQVASNTDLLSDALALYGWAVSERRQGRRIVSEGNGDRKVLVLPRLERVDPEIRLPHVEIKWTKRQRAHLDRLLSSTPAKPTPALVRALRG